MENSASLVDRPQYVQELEKWAKQTDLVKIVTGVRRCGKSKLLELFQTKLVKEHNVSLDNVISINLEDDTSTKQVGLSLNSNKKLYPFDALLEYILHKMQPNQMNYIFIDEVQLLEDWQRVANTLRLKENTDVYLTGSNAYMFSSDLANAFGGRYVEIKIQPYSLSEYCNAYTSKIKDAKPNQSPLQEIYNNYLATGGFPKVLDFVSDQEMIARYLADTVYLNTLQKDIASRFNVLDTSKLDAVTKFLFDNIGNETSVRSMATYLKNKNTTVSAPTIDTYIKGLLDSYLIYKCNRYDIKGKEYLDSNAKYYVVDIGLRNALLGQKDTDMGHILENIVYLELLRRGYRVSVGKLAVFRQNKRKTLEVDFVAEKGSGIKEYYQVALYALEPTVLERELAPLKEIDDNYPKYILSMDSGKGVTEGINRINVLDWLANKV